MGHRIGSVSSLWLLQLREFSFCSDENGDVRVGVFPEGEEILVRSASFCRIARESLSAGQS